MINAKKMIKKIDESVKLNEDKSEVIYSYPKDETHIWTFSSLEDKKKGYDLLSKYFYSSEAKPFLNMIINGPTATSVLVRMHEPEEVYNNRTDSYDYKTGEWDKVQIGMKNYMSQYFNVKIKY